MRRNKAVRRAVTVVLAAAATVVATQAPAQAAPVIVKTTPLINLNTYELGKTKVMAVLNASTGNTAPMIQAPWTDDAPDNDWIVVEKESTANVYRLKPLHTYSPDGNVHNDKCLAVKNADGGNNIPIVNATCTYDDTDNDVWFMEWIKLDAQRGTYQIRNQMTKKCITTKNAATDNAPLITFDCNGGHNGYWNYGQV
ncbi:hypothetical protein Ais01nite_13240 [Asanoa ishikariensis]|uniref:Ricin B lectin domain-containing protein n=1 Tax=Asanoa ishikariensis TaxID=137265 RepID=A0A1H3SYS4_9ACTN|nr:RICIN domain-containing protein [Asanoa ishikariensis]GIF63289.1 hypothetical protein Ais01nite_13240 [Asanoa ishikariensis]SDZ42731.1 hypothetical protein SAMN05421684_4903 [Asanoa ishikariensis]